MTNPVVRVFAHHRFQLWLNVVMFIVALCLIVAAPALGLLQSVAFVSWLSILALVYGGLGGVAAALVYRDAKTGYVLNAADWSRIERMIAGEVDEQMDEAADEEL